MGPLDQAPIRSLPAGPRAALVSAPPPAADTSTQGHEVGHNKSQTARSDTPTSSQPLHLGFVREMQHHREYGVLGVGVLHELGTVTQRGESGLDSVGGADVQPSSAKKS